ncbi:MULTISPECIES: ABC transporter substrate-binding protein [unclassified Microbacterium]|uniref:ABC transporter substrate-binding protein n=1 Tax=Microbacterium TaxID=33882 RepID=UPI003BA07E87
MTRPLTRRSRNALAITAASVLLLSGCASPGTSASSSDEEITLVIANSQWLDALRGESLWNAVKTFEDSHPGIVLEQEAIPSAEIDAKLTTEFGAGQGPDIAIIQEGLFYTLQDAGFLAPIDDALRSIDNLNATNEGGEIDGEVYGLAWQRAVYALIYNADLLESSGAEVPTTLDDLIENAQLIADTGATGFTGRTSITDFNGWFMDFQNWVYGFGGSWSDGESLTIDTPENVAAVEGFAKLVDASLIPAGEDMPTQRTRFKEGAVGFSIDNSGGTLNIASGGTIPSSSVGAAPLPFDEPGAYQQLFVGVSSATDHEDAAKEFVTWLAGPEGQEALRAASGPDTLATDVPLLDEFVAQNPWAPTFAELAPNAHSTLIEGHEVDTPQIMRIVMEAVERVIADDADPADELAAAQLAIDERFGE